MTIILFVLVFSLAYLIGAFIRRRAKRSRLMFNIQGAISGRHSIEQQEWLRIAQKSVEEVQRRYNLVQSILTLDAYAKTHWQAIEARVDEFKAHPPETEEEMAELNRCVEKSKHFIGFYTSLAEFTKAAVAEFQQECAYCQYLREHAPGSEVQYANL